MTRQAVGEIGKLPVNKWDACSVTDDTIHVVSDFGSGVKLTCGKASYSWGYWHIKEKHMSQYSQLVYATDLNWQDLLYWSIWWSIKNPEKTTTSDGKPPYKACRSRRLYLYNKVTGQLISDKTYRVIYTYRQPSSASLSDGTILTSLPDGRGLCDMNAVTNPAVDSVIPSLVK